MQHWTQIAESGFPFLFTIVEAIHGIRGGTTSPAGLPRAFLNLWRPDMEEWIASSHITLPHLQLLKRGSPASQACLLRTVQPRGGQSWKIGCNFYFLSPHGLTCQLWKTEAQLLLPGTTQPAWPQGGLHWKKRHNFSGLPGPGEASCESGCTSALGC